MFKEFWRLAGRSIEATPSTLSVSWVSQRQVEHINKNLKPGARLSDDDLRHCLRIHVLDIRKNWLHLEHLFVINQIKFAASLSGILEGIESGNYFVACSMLRSSVEITASLDQFVTKHLKNLPTTAQESAAETGAFFKFHENVIKTLYPTRYEFKRFDDSGSGLESHQGSSKRPWEYAPKDGAVDRRVQSALTAVDVLEKTISGSREMYERICEFVHPNVGSSFLLSNQEEHFVDANGIQRFRASIQREHARAPIVAEFMLPNMLQFGARLIQRFDELEKESKTFRETYRNMGQRVSRRTIRPHRKLFGPYTECPCESGHKFRYCCGSQDD